MSVRLEVVHADALEYRADVLALKFAQDLYGVDAKVVGRLVSNGVRVTPRLPPVGESLLLGTEHAIGAPQVLFVGVEPLGKFDYETIRRFAFSVLATLAKTDSRIEHVAMTLHGRGFGLDEAEAFRAEMAGLLDAVRSGKAPPTLRRVSIVEKDNYAVERLRAILRGIFPAETISESRVADRASVQSLDDAAGQLRSVGQDSRKKPHIFVAMPFAEQYTDRFHYGIVGAVNAAGFLCERADLASFTGDVVAWVKDRIGSAALVVADLTDANPNVYLEVGYAWGRGVNTVLIVADGDDLKFDVRTQRCLVFRSIRHLEELLTSELKSLKVPVGS
jgi:hypothetical protein